MTEEIVKELDQEEVTPFHSALLDHCIELVDKSRSRMSKYYCDWDERDRVYQANRFLDRQDREARKNNEPAKMVAPLTSSQVNAFIAFFVMLTRQREDLFELVPTGPEDHELRQVNELVLNSDIRYNRFLRQEHQFLLDYCRFGVGIFKHGWVRETTTLKVEKTETREVFGEEVQETSTEEYEKFVKFEGNKVMAVSPYRFFPDLRLPLTRHQEGEFCACEDEYSKTSLYRLEADGVVAGIKHVNKFEDTRLVKRQNWNTRFGAIDLNNIESSEKMICVTDGTFRIIPNEFEVDGKKPLGDSTVPVMYNIWYANDQRIIRIEEVTNAHDSFPFEIAQFIEDQHHELSKSLAEFIGPLQESVDWFINSRITSVRRTLDNQLVADPSVVDMKTVENRSRVILLKRGVARAGIDRYLKPLPVQDVTQSHVQDVGFLTGLIQAVTGINDNAMGQYHTGRRSATEARVVTQGSASRLVTLCKMIWESAHGEVGRKFLMNSRQYLSQERFVKVVGEDRAGLYEQFSADPSELVGNQDYFVFDGTLPSEKQFLAQSLQELLGLLLTNPESATQFNLDPNKLLNEIYELRGVNGLGRFGYSEEDRMQQLIMQAIQQQAAAGPQAQPRTNSNVQPVRQ